MPDRPRRDLIWAGLVFLILVVIGELAIYRISGIHRPVSAEGPFQKGLSAEPGHRRKSVGAGQTPLGIKTYRIRQDQVGKRFGDTVALSDLTVSIKAGTTVLLRRNGAGKSTLLNLITGVVLPSNRDVRVGGEPAAYPTSLDGQM